MITQPSLFDPPVHRTAGSSERAAARKIVPLTEQREDALYRYADRNGRAGIIRPEGDVLLRTSPNQTQPRLATLGGAWGHELRMVPTNRKRRLNNDPENSLCTVWVTLRYATVEEIENHTRKVA